MIDATPLLAAFDRLKAVTEQMRPVQLQQANALLSAAQSEAPQARGGLVESGHVEEAPEGGYDVVFDAPYAAYQHERLDLYHANGAAKYLERPLLEMEGAFLEQMQEALNKELL